MLILSSYIRYSMHGFNRKNKAELDGNRFEYTLTDNEAYSYKNHTCLDKVYIDDHLTSITFYFLEGKEAKEYINDVHVELERICFNLITYSELPISQPYCQCEIIVNSTGDEVTLNDHFQMHDKCFMFKSCSAKQFYELGINKSNNFDNYEATYKEIFWILHSPHKVIQFMGLYDIMSNLIYSPIDQKKVHDYFGRNKKKYPFIQFMPSRKDETKKEDSLTFLRNAIAHSRQAGIKEYLEASEKISDGQIKQLLMVINDLLCNPESKL